MSTSLEEARKQIYEADRGIAELFEKRMEAVRAVAAYKKENDLPVLDEVQEQRVLERNVGLIRDKSLRKYYLSFMKNTMAVSRQYQEDLLGEAAAVNGEGLGCFAVKALLRHAQIDPAGRKVLILGTGETGRSAYEAAAQMGASEILMVSRTGEEGSITYEEAYGKHKDAQVLINTTSCGMAPEIEDCPADPARFPFLTGVIDLISDPLRTTLVLEAQKRGIAAEGGLYGQVVQAVCSAGLFSEKRFDRDAVERIFTEVRGSRRNIVLTGMSLAGKTTVGTLLAYKLGRELADTDELIIKKEKRAITEIFATDGEGYFRDVESEVIRELAPRTGMIIATGGGAILREKNVDALKKNGVIIFLDRPLDQILPMDDRPLANTREKVVALLEKRYPIYSSVCDEHVPNGISAEFVTDKVLAVLKYQ